MIENESGEQKSINNESQNLRQYATEDKHLSFHVVIFEEFLLPNDK